MQIARNSLDTQAGPSDWFTGAVFIDTVAAPSGPSRVSTSNVHFAPGQRSRADVTSWRKLCRRRSVRSDRTLACLPVPQPLLSRHQMSPKPVPKEPAASRANRGASQSSGFKPVPRRSSALTVVVTLLSTEVLYMLNGGKQKPPFCGGLRALSRTRTGDRLLTIEVGDDRGKSGAGPSRVSRRLFWLVSYFQLIGRFSTLPSRVVGFELRWRDASQ